MVASKMQCMSITKSFSAMTIIQKIDDRVVVKGTIHDSCHKKASHSGPKTEKQRFQAIPTVVQVHRGCSTRKCMHRRNRFIIASTTGSHYGGSLVAVPCEKHARRRRNHALTSNEYERLSYANGVIFASM